MVKLKKSVSLFLSFVFVLVLLPTKSVVASAYDANAAVSYAKEHCAYEAVHGACSWQCASFVSACLQAGGIDVDEAIVVNLKNAIEGYGTIDPLKVTNGKISMGVENAGKISPGDVVFNYCHGCASKGYAPYRHVVICTGEDADGYMRDCAHNNLHNNSTFNASWTCRKCGSNNWTHYVCHLNSTPPTPDTVSASTDKKLYCVGENATFSFNAENASSLHLYIYLNGNNYFEGEFSPSSTYSRYLSATGHYAYYIVAHYPNGDKESSWNDFDVVQDFSEYIPAKPDVWADSYSLPINQSVTIYHWSETASSYLVSFYKDDVWQYAETHYTSSFTTSFSSAGNYSIAVQALNEYGESAWNTVGIIVYDTPPSSPTLTINREELAINDEIIFYYNAHNAENYWIGVYKDGELLCEAVSTVNSYGYTPSDPGNYSVVVTAINIFGENYAVKQFSVYNKVSYVVFFGNGGVGVPDDQAKEFGQLMTLSTETPTRDGYTFTGWNTKADGTGTSYAPGDSYTANEDVALYAQWRINLPVVASASGAAIDNKTHQITGLTAGGTAAGFEQNYVSVSDGSFEYEYPNEKQVLGTGTIVKVYNIEQKLVDTYTVVIFGDIDGDSWYDGTDAYFVRLVANGLIARSALTDAQLAACDANHDGVIDNADVALLEQAGLLLNDIDQNAAPEELQTNSVYLEYCSLIDQTVKIVEPEQPIETAESQSAAQSILARLSNLFQIVLNWIYRVFNIQIA